MRLRPLELSIDPGAVTAVHQFVPWLHPGDAVGSHSLKVRAALREMGFASEIFIEGAAPGAERVGIHYNEFPAYAAKSVIVYQMAVGSVVADYVFSRPEPLVVWYHNLTPASFFRPWSPEIAQAVEWGRAQMALLGARACISLADSAYNELELIGADYDTTRVVPIFFDPDEHRANPDPTSCERLDRAKRGGGADWLFVGRIAPNKAQHDIVKALAAYRKAYDPGARLHLVGKPSSAPYAEAVRSLVGSLGLTDAVEFVEGIGAGELAAYYLKADVLVSLSEHEGFCVPLLEAMSNDVPVVAFAAAAVPETAGDAGVMLGSKSPSLVASAVHRVLSDDPLQKQLIRAGRARVEHFSIARSRLIMQDALSMVVGRPPRPFGP